MTIGEKSLKKHYEWKGKIETKTKVNLQTKEDLMLAYTPGVATPCLEIEKDPNKSFLLTNRANQVLVVTDGTAVLGLGDIGPLAGMPVMEERHFYLNILRMLMRFLYVSLVKIWKKLLEPLN